MHRIHAESGLWPTLAEIGAECGGTRITALEHVQALIRKGAVEKLATGSRKYVPVQREWISVEDRLPDDGLAVLAFAPGNDDPVYPAYLIDGEWHWLDGGKVKQSVEAWREFPEAPAAKAVTV